ncbi:MAG TPA: S1C family serine protease [Gemmataceae bacterium]|nr:S1C family serine protease [Gemmataceae bacterium]
MHTWWKRTAAAVLAASLFVGVGTEAKAGHTRENPVVTAVKKAANSVVTVKVQKHGTYSSKEVSGTGVIVDARGYVLTNCHVVANGAGLKVVLPDGSEVGGEVVVEDASHDMAVVKLPSGKYQEMTFAPASDLMVGEEIIAIGHPYGYTNTVSTGIVSALNREVSMPSGDVLSGCIQITASINPGNSGGPLLNINGELIGVNSAVRQDAQGIAFALNADMVQQVLATDLSAGKIAHISHGLTCHEVVTGEDGADRVQVVVDEVAAKSPAAAAGLKKGDVLTKIANRTVTNRFDVERAFWDCNCGAKVDVAMQRDGKAMTATLALVKGDGDRVSASTPAPVVAWDMSAVGTPVNDQK